MKPQIRSVYALPALSLCVALASWAFAQSKPAAPPPAKASHDEHNDHNVDDAHDAHDEHDDHHDHGAGHADEVKLTPEAIRRQNITIERAVKRVLAPSVTCPGRVAFDAEAMAHVGVPVRGRVTQISARAGDSVKEGAELLVIESLELGQAQSDLLQKKSAIAVAESAIQPAKQAFDRAKKLQETNEGIALAEVQRREAELKAADGNLVAAKASLTAAGHTLRLLGMSADQIKKLTESGELDPRYTVRSPIAGQVVQREVTLGELVSPDKDALIVIADLSKVWVLADVPETKLTSFALGTPARVYVAATGKDMAEGQVGHISASLDTHTRTGQVRVVIANPNGKLRPGMFARVELVPKNDAASEQIVAIPEEAVQLVEGKSVVFVPVAGEPNTFAARRVSVEKPIGGLVAVYDGLKEGDSFVATNSFLLKADLGKSGAAHEH